MKTLVFPFLWLFLTLAACDSSENNACVPSCAEAVCGDDGCGGTCGTCKEGLLCVGGSCSTCGNGVRDDAETCDPSAGSRCAQEADCVSENACFPAEYQGSEATCDAVCQTTAITMCVSGDGCCPDGCNPGNDLDCAPENCGNGVLEPNEACDPPEFPCPDVCEPTQTCQAAKLWGYAEGCTLECKLLPITDCTAIADGCCPDGCTANNDGDCIDAVCGDGVITGSETCDTQFAFPDAGSCSPDCNDNRACTTELMSGSVANCDVTCTYVDSTSCLDGDSCCPSGCTPAQDSDCANVVCGDGVVDGDEGCDNALGAGLPGSCPTNVAACDDGDPCTDDSIQGMPGDCSARCVNTPRACADGDGCCPYTCAASEDAECAALKLCDKYCEDTMAYCQDVNELYPAASECRRACVDMPIGHDGDMKGASVYCRIHHLAEAASDPDQHCPHVGETPVDGCN